MSNEQLLAALVAAGREEGALLARVIVMLMEVEERRLHLELAHSSMFVFCVRQLGMSEGETCRRLNVARLAKRCPQVVDALRTRRVNLSSIALLRDVMTPENADALLTEVAGKTTREVEELVAKLAPRPDVRPLIRKLPERAPTLPKQPGLPRSLSSSASPSFSAPPSPSPSPSPSPPPSPSSPASPSPPPSASSSPSISHPPREPARAARQIAPLAESRYRVQFTASSALREKLERAQSLMRHRNIDGDLAVVVERAMDALIAQLEKQKLAATTRPRARSTPAPAPSAPTHAGATAGAKERAKARAKARAVSAATRREVVQRDGEQCTFVGANGERCTARELLEIDHRRPRGRDGGNEPSNLRLLCHAHNLYAAEQVFGRDHVARAIQARRKQKPASTAQADLPLT